MDDKYLLFYWIDKFVSQLQWPCSHFTRIQCTCTCRSFIIPSLHFNSLNLVFTLEIILFTPTCIWVNIQQVSLTCMYSLEWMSSCIWQRNLNQGQRFHSSMGLVLNESLVYPLTIGMLSLAIMYRDYSNGLMPSSKHCLNGAYYDIHELSFNSLSY